MGDVKQQLEQFKLQLAAQLQEPAFQQLATNMAGNIQADLLKKILNYVKALPNEKLASFECGCGEMFVRSDTKLEFSFYVGRNFTGDFHLIQVPNHKLPDGKTGKLVEIVGGAYKRGKPAPLLNLAQSSGDQFYRLTSWVHDSDKNASLNFSDVVVAKTEWEFSRIVFSPYVLRYFKSETYTRGQMHKIALFAPEAAHGDLYNARVCDSGKRMQFSEPELMCFVYATSAGLRHMHNSLHPAFNVCHRDLKTTNMVLHADYLLQYIDFGSWQKQETDARTYLKAPPEYIEIDVRRNIPLAYSNYHNSDARSFWNATPPEERKKWNVRHSGTRADVWGAGLAIYELLYCSSASHTKIANLDDATHGYLKAMLQADPEKRVNSDAALMLYIKTLANTKSPDVLDAWINKIIGYYANDFHRMQFFSELHTAGCEHLIEYLPEAKRKKMPFDKLLDWPYNLTISEWNRIKAFYKPSLTAAELQQFDQKLRTRKEFGPDLVQRSLRYAIRVGDIAVKQSTQISPEKEIAEKCKGLATSKQKVAAFMAFYTENKAKLPVNTYGLWDEKLRALQVLRTEPQVSMRPSGAFLSNYQSSVVQNDTAVAALAQKIIELQDIATIQQTIQNNPQCVRLQPIPAAPGISRIQPPQHIFFNPFRGNYKK